MRSIAENATGDRAQWSPRGRFLIVLALFASFVAYSAIRCPVPGVNEPHTLTKAKHYWDPSFCRGDFYVESPDVYVVFYSTVGQLTRWLTLEQTAWVGRAIALLVLAVGFDRLVSRIVPGRWSALWVAWLYLTIAGIGRSSRLVFGDSYVQTFDLSGEWIVGGVEAKVIAYGLLFGAMGCWIDARRYRAALLAGAAISVHPVVGVWGVGAAAFASIVERLRSHNPATTANRTGKPDVQFLGVIALLAIGALPGLLPALKFAGTGDPQLQQKAAYIQTFYRLQHHLDPMTIPWTAYASYAGLALIWLVGRRRARLHVGERWFTWFVVGSVIILLAGVALGYRTGPPGDMPYWQLRTRLLRFYPFRLADAMIPIAASIVLVGLARQFVVRETIDTTTRILSWRMAPVVVLFGALIAAMLLPTVDRNPSRLSGKRLADWKDICGWVAAETPGDALFLTPTSMADFKWYAGRPEFVCYKDCPQDAAGIVEWNERLRFLRKWQTTNADSEGRISANAVRELREQSKEYVSGGIRYIVSVDGLMGPFPLKPIYENGTCRVYSLENLK